MRAMAEALRVGLEQERDRAPLWLPVFMGAGVLTYYALRFEPAWWLGLAAALPAAVLAMWRPWIFAPLAAVALGFASAQVATLRTPPMTWRLPTHATIVTGTVAAVELLPEARRITIGPAFLDGVALPRLVRIRLRADDDGDLVTGDTVRVRALVRPPASPAYPGAWDLQRDAFYAGRGASGFALGPAEQVGTAEPSGFAALLRRLRERIAQRVVAVLPDSSGAIAMTLLTGDQTAIPADDHAAFRNSGLAHLLAVAGLHIGIVMGFVLLVARGGFALSEYASLHWPTRKLAALCTLAVGGCYMLLTGMHLPIIRSFLMASLFTLALLADRRPFSLRGLALAGVVLMLLSPYEVPGVSFQMSFSAVLALIAGYEALRPWLRRLHGAGWWRWLLSHVVALALTSILAGLASAPVGAYHFGQVQLYFVLANVAAVPLTAVWVMPAGLVALALMPLHLEALALLPMGWGIDLLLWIARHCSALPAATLRVPHMPVWGLALFGLGLAWLGLWRSRWRLLGVAVIAAGLASVALVRPPDLLISDDARMIAVRTPDGAFVRQVHGGSRFVRDAWATYWAVDTLRPLPAAMGCTGAPCLLRPYPDRTAVLLVNGQEKPASCGGIAVIVSSEPARGLCPKPWPALVDRFTVWRNGAAAVWLDAGGARVVTDRDMRGDRPWVPPMPVPKAKQAVKQADAPLAAVSRNARKRAE